MSETILKVQHLGKSFGNNEILKDIDFSQPVDFVYSHNDMMAIAAR